MIEQSPTRGAASPIRRNPDWRYRLARSAAMSGRLLSPSNAEALVRHLSVFLYRRRLCRNRRERRRLHESPLGRRLAGLLRIAEDPTRRLPSIVETLALGEVRPAQIAKVVGVDVADIIDYESMYFDVRQVLHDQQFIRQKAILPELQCGPPEDARRRCGGKFLAYTCGVAVLNQLCPMLYQARRELIPPPQLIDGLLGELVLEGLADLLTAKHDMKRFRDLEGLRAQLSRYDGMDFPKTAVEHAIAVGVSEDVRGSHGWHGPPADSAT
jgi:hypothetical protein